MAVRPGRLRQKFTYLKLRRLPIKVFPNNWQISKALPDLLFAYMAFRLRRMYDCIAKLCRQQAEVVQNQKKYATIFFSIF
jgi:hypothetical protein